VRYQNGSRFKSDESAGHRGRESEDLVKSKPTPTSYTSLDPDSDPNSDSDSESDSDSDSDSYSDPDTDPDLYSDLDSEEHSDLDPDTDDEPDISIQPDLGPELEDTVLDYEAEEIRKDIRELKKEGPAKPNHKPYTKKLWKRESEFWKRYDRVLFLHIKHS
jgi:hypothetical protein